MVGVKRMKNYSTFEDKSIDYGVIDGTYFFSINKINFNIIEIFLKIIRDKHLAQIIVYNLDSSIDKEQSNRIRQEGIEHTFYKNGIVMNAHNFNLFANINFKEETGGLIFSVFDSTYDFDVSDLSIPNKNLLSYNLFDQYKINKNYMNYLNKFKPVVHFIDGWDRQEIVATNQDIFKELLKYFNDL